MGRTSSVVTSWPWATKWRARCRPRKPAPPETAKCIASERNADLAFLTPRRQASEDVGPGPWTAPDKPPLASWDLVPHGASDRARPDDQRELHQPTEPEARGREMHPVRELRLPRRAGVRGRVPRQREAGREAERDRKRNPEQRTLFEQPRQEEQSGDEREAERHRDERRAEARTARDRREVAVQQPRER